MRMVRLLRGLGVAIQVGTAVSAVIFVLLLLVDRWDLILYAIRVELVVLTVPIAIWLTGTVWLWNETRRLGPFTISDRSRLPVTMPDALAVQEADLKRLGFTPTGQYEIDMAWPEKAPRTYALFTLPQNPGVYASLSFTIKGTCFASYWADGRAIETVYPPLEIDTPKGTDLFPPWSLYQFSDDGVEAAYRLHLAAVVAAEPVAGKPIPVTNLATVSALEATAMRRIHEYHAGKTLPVVRRSATLAAFAIPAWLVLTWIAFAAAQVPA
jgi:hypothetical protein